MNSNESGFGHLKDGTGVSLYTFKNSSGLSAAFSPFGAALVSVSLPDRTGKVSELTLGFDDVSGYEGPHPYFGVTVGRVANRIRGGRFTMNGIEYTLPLNNGENHLHGGPEGFSRKLWQAEPFSGKDASGVRFSYFSPSGDAGYPGGLSVGVIYSLTENNELILEFQAQAEDFTPVNITNHAYWNLSDGGLTPIYGHILSVNADYYLPAGEGLIPTGETAPVGITPYDLRKPLALEKIIEHTGGIDNCYILTPSAKVREEGLKEAAIVKDPVSGRIMEVLTTYPSMQVYTGNFLEGKIQGRGGVKYAKHSAFCLETQHYSGALNFPEFPSIILSPGKVYREKTIHRFSSV